MHVPLVVRLLTILTGATGLALTGCRIQPGTTSATVNQPDSITTSLGPGEAAPDALQRLATTELRSRNRKPLDVPTPPGVEPELLAERRVGRSLARLGADEAIEFLLNNEPTDTASDTDQVAIEQPSEDSPTIPETASEDAALREYALGRDQALQRRHLAAVTHFLKAIELSPGNPDVLRELARSYLGLGNQTKALQTYEQLLAVEPMHSEATLMVALAAADRREFDAAARLLGKRRLAGKPFTHDDGADVLGHYVLGLSLGQLGYDRASIDVTRNMLGELNDLTSSSIYASRLGSLYRQRGELWRSIGDAYCRLGEYESALSAYEHSAELPMPDPFALAPRVLYANLRLGRTGHAQLELFAALRSEAPNVNERLIGLCTYMREHGGSMNALAESVSQLQLQYPNDPTLVRTAAALLDDRQATALLSQYVSQQPNNMQVVGELLQWLAESDLSAAAALTADVVAERPNQANKVIQQLFFAAARPSDAVDAVKALPPTASTAVVHGRLLLMMGGLGPAWQVLDDAAATWPENVALHRTRMDVAAGLDEPGLLQHIIDTWSGESDVETLLATSRACRRAGLSDQAVNTAQQAAERAPNDPDVLTELAWAHLSVGIAAPTPNDAALHGQDAVQFAEQAIAADPTFEPAYKVLTAVYGPGGPLADPAELREAARRLFNADPDSRLYKQLVAEESLARRRYEQALEQSLSLYETQPWDTASLKMVVAAWRSMNRLEDAARWLDNKLNLRPGDPNLLEQWVTVQLMMNRTDAAMARLEQQVNEHPFDYAALRLLETASRATNRNDRANQLAEQRLLARPAGIRRELELASLYGATDREDNALRQLRSVLDQADAATGEQLIAAVGLAARLDAAERVRDDMVLALVDATTARYSELPLEFYRPAILIRARRDADSGVFETFAKQVVRDVAATDGAAEQAVLRWQQMAQQLVDAGFPHAAAVLTEARLLTAPEINNDAAFSVLCLVTFSAQAGAGNQAEQSIALLRELRQRGRLPMWPSMDGPPTLDGLLYELSQMYHILGDEDGSLVILRELIGIQPQHAMALNNLGYMLIEKGADDLRTARMIELAYKLDPDEPNILDSIGWLRYKQGVFDDAPEETRTDDTAEQEGDEPVGDDPQAENSIVSDGALNYIRRSVNNDNTPSPESMDHLGDVLWRLGRTDEAVSAWERALGLLNNEREVSETKEMYQMLQQRIWWLVVADPESIYDRNWGVIRQRTEAKLQAVADGTPPPIAPTFEELQSGSE